ncbi:hypothetical protein [Apilactobacillus xinyiensis]|uniref:hypothetical protein n=1 Tax=Apilactobacillus xinyiensis TaxID=2841032 RepID=UPI00336520E4
MKIKKYITLAMACLSLSLLLTACGKSYQGKYKDKHGETLNIQSDNKVSMSKDSVTVNGKYKQSKDKITMTFSADGNKTTLNGELDKNSNLYVSNPDADGSLKFNRVK